MRVASAVRAGRARGQRMKQLGELVRLIVVLGRDGRLESVVELRQYPPGMLVERDRQTEAIDPSVVWIDVATNDAPLHEPVDQGSDAGGRDPEVVPQLSGSDARVVGDEEQRSGI